MRRTHRRTAKLLRFSLSFVFAATIVSNSSDCVFASSSLRWLAFSATAFRNSNTNQFADLRLIQFDAFSPAVPQSGTSKIVFASNREGSMPGMNFTAQIHAPTFISEPSQSGIKYVQAESAFEKYTQRGIRCRTIRTSETDVDSGWQLDTRDPANPPNSTDYPIHRFNEGNDLTALMTDRPRQPLTGISDWESRDNAYLDDRFIMYLVYFVGSNPANPSVQRPIGQLQWRWGATIGFEWVDSLNHGMFNIFQTTTGYTSGVPITTMVTMNGNVSPFVERSCPGGAALTNYKIDSSRAFVSRHYLDFLNRDPEGDVGWDFWTSEISNCGFDAGCIHSERIHIGLAFFYSSEFIDTDPDMANPPGTPNFNPAVYNRKFVYWCYRKYLRRDPNDSQVDMDGWAFWTGDLNSNGDYAHTIDAFQLSDDYRNRLGNGLQ